MVGASAIVAAVSLLAKTLGRGVGGEELHPLQIAAGRFVSAFIVMALISAWLRPSLAGANWPVHAGRSVCGWAALSLMFTAVMSMPLAEATAISFLSPLATMMLAIPILGERVGPIRWSAAGIAMVGAIVLIRPGTEAFQPAALLALASALFMGLEAILIKQLSSREPPIRILLINNGIGSLIGVAFASLVWVTPSPVQWLLMAGLGSMLGAQVLFIQAMRAADASYVMPFFYATLLFAALYDVALFGEWPDLWSQLGVVIIVGGGLLLAWREHQRAAMYRRDGPDPTRKGD